MVAAPAEAAGALAVENPKGKPARRRGSRQAADPLDDATPKPKAAPRKPTKEPNVEMMIDTEEQRAEFLQEVDQHVSMVEEYADCFKTVTRLAYQSKIDIAKASALSKTLKDAFKLIKKNEQLHRRLALHRKGPPRA